MEQRGSEATVVSWRAAMADFQGIALGILVLPPLMFHPDQPISDDVRTLSKEHVDVVWRMWLEDYPWLKERITSAIAKLAACVCHDGYVLTLSQIVRTPQWNVSGSYFDPCGELEAIASKFKNLIERRDSEDKHPTVLLHKHEGMYMGNQPFYLGYQQRMNKPRRLGVFGMPTGLIHWHLWGVHASGSAARRYERAQHQLFTTPVSEIQNRLLQHLARPALFDNEWKATGVLMDSFIKRCSFEYDTILVIPPKATIGALEKNRRVLTISEEEEPLWVGKTPNGEWRSEWEDTGWAQLAIVPRILSLTSSS